jgi:Condensation domain
MHHIISDGWSMGVLVREVAALYEAFGRGGESPLAELPVQYADYALWQRGWLRGEALEAQLAYWRRQLAGAPPLLELPGAGPRAGAGRAARRLTLGLGGPGLGAGLRRLARRRGATLFMTLLAAFQVALGRAAGRRDVVVGTDVAGRVRPELEGLIGFFVNQLVLRTELTGEGTFGELLGRVREVCLGAYQHQDVPFERVVEELRPERGLGQTPLYQVKLLGPEGLWGGRVGGVARLGGVEMEWVEGGWAAAQADLIVGVEECAGGGLRARVEYDAGLYGEGAVRGLARGFGWALEWACAEGAEGLGVSGLAAHLDLKEKEHSLDEERALEEISIHKLKQVRRRNAGDPSSAS